MWDGLQAVRSPWTLGGRSGVAAEFEKDGALGRSVILRHQLPRRVGAFEQRRAARRVRQPRKVDADVLIRAGGGGARHLRSDAGVGERPLQPDAADLAAEL